MAIAGMVLLPSATRMRILTDRGEVAVEDLRIGEQIATEDGIAAPIVWVGARHVDCGRHPMPETVLPIWIAAHAFGPGQPASDLFLSPDHAVYVEEVLIPVRHLVNGRSIRQVALPAVRYLHVELPFHTVILVEGLAIESYLDTGDRGAFANGGSVVALHPTFGPIPGGGTVIAEVLGYAPRRTAGPEVTRVQATLARRAAPRPRRAKVVTRS